MIQRLTEMLEIEIAIPIVPLPVDGGRLYWSDFALAAVEAAHSPDPRVRQLFSDIQRLTSAAQEPATI